MYCYFTFPIFFKNTKNTVEKDFKRRLKSEKIPFGRLNIIRKSIFPKLIHRINALNQNPITCFAATDKPTLNQKQRNRKDQSRQNYFEIKQQSWEVILLFSCLFVCLFVCFETQSHYVALAIDQASLELTEIHQCLPPEYWD